MGAADHLPKTVDPEILRARIEASLAGKRLRDLERDSMAEQARLLGTIERQKTELSRFLSPQVAALVSSDDGESLLAGHRREITAMFCDLRQFTVFSDAAEPEEVLGFLRAYHGLMGPLIVEPRGHARALRRRRLHDLLQRPGRCSPTTPLRAVRLAAAMRDALRGPERRVAAARLHAGARHRHRDRLRDAGRHRVRGPLRLRRRWAGSSSTPRG